MGIESITSIKPINSIDVELKVPDNKWMDATLSVKQTLIMLHSECISAQWPLDGTSVELTNLPDGTTKVGFHHTGCASGTYQSFYFNGDIFITIEMFFKSWCFPVPRIPVIYGERIKIYPLIDKDGIEWRFDGSNPVSQIADATMGVHPPEEENISRIQELLDSGLFPDLKFKERLQ